MKYTQRSTHKEAHTEINTQTQTHSRTHTHSRIHTKQTTIGHKPETDEWLNELIVGYPQHSVPFVLDVGDEIAHLLEGFGDALFVFGLRGPDAIEFELFQLIRERSLGFGQVLGSREQFFYLPNQHLRRKNGRRQPAGRRRGRGEWRQGGMRE